MKEFSPEQEVMLALLVHTGSTRADAESIVRAEPVAAALLGSHLAPPLQRIAGALAGLIDTLNEAGPA